MPHEPTQTLGVAVWTQCGPVPTTSVMATKQRQIYVLDDDGSNTILVAYPLIEETPDFYVVQTIGVKGKKGRKRLAKVADDVFGTAQEAMKSLDTLINVRILALQKYLAEVYAATGVEPPTNKKKPKQIHRSIDDV